MSIKTKHAVFSWEFRQQIWYFTAFYVRMNKINWETKK